MWNMMIRFLKYRYALLLYFLFLLACCLFFIVHKNFYLSFLFFIFLFISLPIGGFVVANAFVSVRLLKLLHERENITIEDIYNYFKKDYNDRFNAAPLTKLINKLERDGSIIRHNDNVMLSDKGLKRFMSLKKLKPFRKF